MPLKRLPRRLQHGEEATLVEHLGELRGRILIALLALVPVFILAFVFRDTLIDVLTRPLPDDKKLVTLGVTEPFTTAVKVSLAAAFAVTLPLLLYQLWAFLAPALEEGVQRTVAVFATIATLLFACGVAFSYFVVLPRALSFLTHFGDEFFQIEIRASYYFSFVTMTLLASGLAFQMPIFVLALVRLRVLSAAKLRRNRRVGIALMIVFAVLLPTVDPVSLVLEAAPLILLFELSIQLAGFMEKRWDIADQKSRWAVE
jgi:sec-independent protein translocase protein TatC